MAPASYQVGQGKPPRAQYHHFIPRFILRNYASSIQLPTGSAKRRQNRRSQSQAKDGTLNVIDLENVKVTQTPVSRTFGQLDMYRDFNGADQFDLEKRLSKLESQAGIILGKVRKAFEIGSPDIWLKRAERDTLRKFLFIMKYRSQCFYQRYNPETGAYEADDKELMLNYMKDKGITNPMDVWFRNLKAFIELDMDPEGEWIEKIQEQAYPGDARWFGAHIQGAYLAFCQTSRPDDEFLLTGNAYAIFEGANSETFDPATGIGTTVVYSEYHCFAPLSPTLMIVLRSNLLPDGRKEPDETDVLFQFTKSLHLDPASADSTLQDLPVKKCRNSYSRVEHGESILTEAYALPRSQHSFCFQFFRVTSQHVQTINNIMLAEASSMSTIVFKSIAATRNALEKYLTEYDPKYKIVLDSPNDKQAIFFSNLEAIVQQLGGSARSNHKIHYLQKNEEEFFDTMGQRIRDALPTTDTPFMRLYRKLGQCAPIHFNQILQNK
ncbi:hypothetical protein MMC24_001030 [Lignoscripta atroalba]|nr:hypothetical protein [Lignoscripta atroalba]